LTYLHRTQPATLAIEILSPLQIKVLKATSKVKLPTQFTVSWAISAIARLGGYLEHRRGPIGGKSGEHDMSRHVNPESHAAEG